jgi:hypothetical protein
MNKIPVGKVISESLNFSIRNYLSLLGVLWLPMLLSLLFTWFLMFPHFQAVAAGAGGLRPAGSPLTGLGIEAVHLALLAVMSVGVTRVALGLREGPRFVYLSVGAAELRVFGGYILLGIIMIVLGIGLAVILGFLTAIVGGAFRAGAASDPAAMSRMTAVATPFVMLGVFLPVLYFGIRLSSFMSAVAVAEHRFGLWRSWALTRSNFWRLFVIVMAVWIPLMVLYAVALSLAMGPALTKVIAAASLGPATLRAAYSEMLMSAVSKLKYAVLVVLPFAPVLYGLIIAPGAFAYRALVPPPAADAASAFD